MFSGIDAVLRHYEPVIISKASQHKDIQRAPLNQHDLEQELRRVVLYCWNIQMRDTETRNFDIWVKHCMENRMLTLKGKEFCAKRGRCKIVFMSDLCLSPDGSEERDVESIIHASKDDNVICMNGGNSGMDHLMAEIRDHLDCPNLARTFDEIVLNFTDKSFDCLNPDLLTSRNRKKISQHLGIAEQELLTNLRNIQFILSGFQENFMGRVWN